MDGGYVITEEVFVHIAEAPRDDSFLGRAVGFAAVSRLGTHDVRGLVVDVFGLDSGDGFAFGP